MMDGRSLAGDSSANGSPAEGSLATKLPARGSREDGLPPGGYGDARASVGIMAA